MLKRIQLTILFATLFCCTQCISRADVAGRYESYIENKGVIELLKISNNGTYYYFYQSPDTTYHNYGKWNLKTTSGYTYLVIQNWKMLRAGCLGNNSGRPETISFEIDGDVISMIKDKWECSYRKVSNQ